MRWIEALKIYNKDKMWCVPRKGTPEHAAVLTIMKGEQPKPKAPLRRKRIVPKDEPKFKPIPKAMPPPEEPRRSAAPTPVRRKRISMKVDLNK